MFPYCVCIFHSFIFLLSFLSVFFEIKNFTICLKSDFVTYEGLNNFIPLLLFYLVFSYSSEVCYHNKTDTVVSTLCFLLLLQTCQRRCLTLFHLFYTWLSVNGAFPDYDISSPCNLLSDVQLVTE